MRIRRLRANDWEVFRDVRFAALVDAPEVFGSSLAVEQARTEREWRARLERRVQFVAALAAQHGQPRAVVGTVGVIRSRERDDRAELVSMWVAASSRGQGVGDALVRAAIEVAHRSGCAEIELWVADGNRYAEGLYTRHGFVRTGAVQPIRDDEPDRLEFAMARPLGR